MEAIILFDAKNWIRDNFVSAHDLHEDTLKALSNFTLMWSIFEKVACDSSASVTKFEALAEDLVMRTARFDALQEAMDFWIARYWTGSEFNDRFNGLNFRATHHRKHVEAVLKGDVLDFKSKVNALMLIVYRLRNNLFHGIKEVEFLDDQMENLDMASRVLATILSMSGKSIIRRVNCDDGN